MKNKDQNEIEKLVEKGFGKLLSEGFELRLEKIVNSITEANFVKTNERINTLQNTVNITNEQLADDRKDISDVKLNQKKIQATVDGLRDDFVSLAKRVVNKVDEALQPMPDIVADQVKTSIDEGMDKKKIIYAKPKGFFKWLFRRR